MSSLVELIGHPLVSRATAENVGQLNDAVIDVDGRAVVAWQIGKGRKATVVENAHLTGIGQAAAMLDEESSLRAAESVDEVATLKGQRSVIKARVLSDAGDVLGVVEDLEIDPDSGQILVVRTSGGDVEPDRMRGFGSYALVVAAG